MSHFYGVVQGTKGPATRCGDKLNGLDVTAASWAGCITVHLWHDEATGEDRFAVRQAPWHGRGVDEVIASGVVGEAFCTIDPECRDKIKERDHKPVLVPSSGWPYI